MKPDARTYGIDLDYLRRSKEMTPGARLDWLAAAREFALSEKKQVASAKRTYSTVALIVAVTAAGLIVSWALSR